METTQSHRIRDRILENSTHATHVRTRADPNRLPGGLSRAMGCREGTKQRIWPGDQLRLAHTQVPTTKPTHVHKTEPESGYDAQ